MITQVIGIPDSNGVIRVSCGHDTIEVHIPSALSASGGGVSMIGNAPLNAQATPGAAPPKPVYLNPFDNPMAYIAVPCKEDGGFDILKLVEQVNLQFADPTRPDPCGIVYSTLQANVHEITRLNESVAQNISDLPLVLDFSRVFKG